MHSGGPVPGKGSAVALCLAGGGYPGAYFEFGAVAALEAGIPGWGATDSCVIVGTSCGAVVGAVLTLGMTSAEVRESLEPGSRPSLAMRRRDFSRVPWGRYARGWGGILTAFPRLLVRHTERGRLHWGRLVEDAKGYLPAGMFTNQGLEDLLHRVSEQKGSGERFENLGTRLLVTATALDSGERSVFGTGYDASPSLSLAVRASSAIPGFFAPVEVNSREYIDGQIFDPIHLDLAGGRETRLVFAVSPLNPFVGSDDGAGRVSRLGTAAVWEQAARISAAIKRRTTEAAFRKEHPGVPVLSIEPDADEVYRLMRIGFGKDSLLAAWKIGFGAAARMLRGDAAEPALGGLGLTLDLESLGRREAEWM